MKANGYWTEKHWSRTNLEVIRTIAGVIAAIGNAAAVGRVLGVW